MGWMVPMMAAAEQKQSEERLLAELIAKDVNNAYEYKMLHGHMGAFRKPERLQTILDEERRARWQLVMKLDDERLILRRPRRVQAYDSVPGVSVDPYRTQVGGRPVWIVAMLMGLLGLGATVGVLFAGSEPTGLAAGWPAIMVAISVSLLLVLLIAIKRAR